MKQTLVGLQGVSSRNWTSARPGEDLRKLMFFQRPRFFKTRSKACRLFKFAQRFPISTLGQKINLVLGKKSPVTHRKNFKELLEIPKIAPQHSRGSCVRWKRRIKPKIGQQILGTRRFTKMNTELSCTPSTQFHLGTDVRYHYVPKYTSFFHVYVFHVFFKIAVHWKKLASSNSLQQRRN